MKGPEHSAALYTENLTVGYTDGQKENQLLANLNLQLVRGQMVCFMGPNGIGKSTLIRTLAKIQEPLHGMVRYSNDSPTRSPDKDLSQRLAVVLTDRISNLNISVYDLITFGRYPYLNWSIKLTKQDNDIIQNAIEQVNIASLVNKRLYELSDGQLQMAMIARTLAQDVDIILLDEPTAHLDLNNRVEIMNLLRNLSRNSGKAILIATHELDLALQTADLIWLAGKNKSILTGIPEDLVLNGAFDEIFQFKGFDLKTGKVLHEAHRKTSIQLSGNGPEFLWTKNALERAGYTVESRDAEIEITMDTSSSPIQWIALKKRTRSIHTSLASLLSYLQDD